MRGIILRCLAIMTLSLVFIVQLEAQDIKILPTNAVSILKLGYDVGKATSKVYFDSIRDAQKETARNPTFGSDNGGTNDKKQYAKEPVVSNAEAETPKPKCDNCASN